MSLVSTLNIFYMYCYAWKLLREGKSLIVGATDSPNAVEFFARVFINGARLLLRRGLEQGYREIEDEVVGLRGRVLVGSSYRRLLIQQGKTICRFDEMGHDTLNNRIIKSTLEILIGVTVLQAETRRVIVSLLPRFADVSPIKLNASVFTQISLNRNNSYYALILKLCELIFGHLLPTGDAGRFTFANPVDDETRMSAVFEEFVRVFCQTELDGYTSAGREDIQWVAGQMDREHARHLPKMQTDVTLRSFSRTLIVDAKFYKDIFVNFRDAEKLRSGHLYQMFAYLKNCDHVANGVVPDGLLIYPSSERSISLGYELGGHKIRLATVDLMMDWPDIDTRLRKLLAAYTSGTVA